MNSNQEHNLLGHWVHSHEEDANNLMVFRISNYKFPPARGRDEYKLEKGGKLQMTHPGPTDKRVSISGNWSLEEDGNLIIHAESGEAVKFKIESLDKNKLVLIRQ